jgi:hypothetical protein
VAPWYRSEERLQYLRVPTEHRSADPVVLVSRTLTATEAPSIALHGGNDPGTLAPDIVEGTQEFVASVRSVVDLREQPHPLLRVLRVVGRPWVGRAIPAPHLIGYECASCHRAHAASAAAGATSSTIEAPG